MKLNCVYNDIFLAKTVAWVEIYSYLCNVFFIVLDLRLTKVEYSGTPFFMPFLIGFLRLR